MQLRASCMLAKYYFLIGWLLPTKFIPYNLWYRNSYFVKFNTLQIVGSYKTWNETKQNGTSQTCASFLVVQFLQAFF